MLESLFNKFAELDERLHHKYFSMKKFYLKNTFLTTEASVRRCFKKRFSQKFRKIYKKIPVPHSLSQQSCRLKAYNFIKKDSLAQVFSCEFCEISKNTFFYRTPPVAASVTGHLRTTASDTYTMFPLYRIAFPFPLYRIAGPFRNDLSRFAAQWKQKCCWVDPAPLLFPFGAIR